MCYVTMRSSDEEKDVPPGITVVRLPGKQKVRGSSPAEGLSFSPFCCRSISLLSQSSIYILTDFNVFHGFIFLFLQSISNPNSLFEQKLRQNSFCCDNLGNRK